MEIRSSTSPGATLGQSTETSGIRQRNPRAGRWHIHCNHQPRAASVPMKGWASVALVPPEKLMPTFRRDALRFERRLQIADYFLARLQITGPALEPPDPAPERGEDAAPLIHNDPSAKPGWPPTKGIRDQLTRRSANLSGRSGYGWSVAKVTDADARRLGPTRGKHPTQSTPRSTVPGRWQGPVPG